jgi:hypothetical protein
MRVSAYVDDRALRDAFRKLGPEARNALSRANRRASVSVQKQARADAFAELNLPKSPINALIKTGRAPSRSNPTAEVRISAKEVRLVDYLGERQTKLGVTVQIHRGGARKLIKHVFLARMPTGHKGIFRRIGGRRGTLRGSIKSRKTYRPELPIRELRAKTVRQVFTEPKIARLLEIARARVTETLRQELNYRLEKRSRTAF